MEFEQAFEHLLLLLHSFQSVTMTVLIFSDDSAVQILFLFLFFNSQQELLPEAQFSKIQHKSQKPNAHFF